MANETYYMAKETYYVAKETYLVRFVYVLCVMHARMQTHTRTHTQNTHMSEPKSGTQV